MEAYSHINDQLVTHFQASLSSTESVYVAGGEPENSKFLLLIIIMC